MSRHYRRRNNKVRAFALIIILASVFFVKFYPYSLIVIGLFFLPVVAMIIRKLIINRSSEHFEDTTQYSDFSNNSHRNYSLKTSLITPCENSFFTYIKDIVGENYIVQPQINLASIIDKSNHAKYRTELFRNVDFGIFDKAYRPLVLIEINDATHHQRQRKERDQKVKFICQEAGIPLITFWTEYGVNYEYIKKCLLEHIVLYEEPITVNDVVEEMPEF